MNRLVRNATIIDATSSHNGRQMDLSIINGVIEADSRCLKDPAPLVAVAELADSSVNIYARPWVNSEDFFATKLDLTRKVKERFDAQGISIPFPQQDVHMHQVQAKAA